MKKLLFGLISLLLITSCVSQKKYNELQSKYRKEVSRGFFDREQLKSTRKINRRIINSMSKENETLRKEKIVLERELNKTIIEDNQHRSHCFLHTSDSVGIYLTVSFMDTASTASQAMVLAYSKSQDSIKTVCDEIILNAIDLYTTRVNQPFDTINTKLVYEKTVHSICNDVWKDSMNTYWAIEIQRIYWSDFIDNYLTEVVELENNYREFMNEIENDESGEYDNKYMQGFLRELKEKDSRKLDKELFADLLREAISSKFNK